MRVAQWLLTVTACLCCAQAAEIHDVVRRMDMPRLLQLLHGASLEATDSAGATPLLLASEVGCVEMSVELVAAGARLEGAAPDGRTALMVAAAGGYHDVVEALLEAGANSQAVDGAGNNALALARRPVGSPSFYSDHQMVIKMLLRPCAIFFFFTFLFFFNR